MKDREKKVVALEKIFQKPRFQIMDMFDLPRGSGAEGSKEAPNRTNLEVFGETGGDGRETE